MIPPRSFPRALSCLNHALLLGLLFQGAAIAGPREDAQIYVRQCLSVPHYLQLSCLRAAEVLLHRDYGGYGGSSTSPGSSSGGSWSGRNSSGVYDGSGGCEGGSCINILD
jgi:uncharacterized membrane protein YgcG